MIILIVKGGFMDTMDATREHVVDLISTVFRDGIEPGVALALASDDSLQAIKKGFSEPIGPDANNYPPGTLLAYQTRGTSACRMGGKYI